MPLIQVKLLHLRYTIFWLAITAALSLLFTVFFKGIFFDGLVYGSISRNLAEGNGTLFDLHYTETVGNHFIDNLPLFYWIQSIFFKVLGDHFWTEKVFCLTLVIASIYFLRQIVRKTSPPNIHWQANAVMVSLLYLFNPGILWVFSSNMTECLLIPLTLAFVYWFYCHFKYNAGLNWLISSVLLFAIILTKGPNGMFVLGIYPLWGLLHRQFLYYCIQGLVLLAFSFSLLLLLYLVNNEFAIYLNEFISKQLMASIAGERESSGSHFMFVEVYLNHFLAPILLSIFFLVRRKLKSIRTTWNNHSILLFAIGLLQPLMFIVSTKQNAYYFSVSYAFFYLSFGCIFFEELISVYHWFEKRWKRIPDAMQLTSLIIALGLFVSLNFYFFGKPARDRDQMNTALKISEQQHSSIVLINYDQRYDWTLIGYLQRNHKRSVALADTSSTTYPTKSPLQN